MASQLPLLVFPTAKSIPPPKGGGFPASQPHFPAHSVQVARLGGQLTVLKEQFAQYGAEVSGTVAGMEPETVLVIEIVGRVEDFSQAVHAIGLEWLGEWDLAEICPDDNFYETDSKGKKTGKQLGGRLFLSIANQAGMAKMLSLWGNWKNNERLPIGTTKWRDVFNQITKIRRWGIEETLGETGMTDRWERLLDRGDPTESVRFQIELFYRRNREKRSNRSLPPRFFGRPAAPTPVPAPHRRARGHKPNNHELWPKCALGTGISAHVE